MRVVRLGNAGAGKATMARQLIRDQDIAHLSLDAIACSERTARRPLADSLRALERFLDAHEQWGIEGCYGELVEAALPRCTELRFPNPGVDACLAHCRERPWESEQFASAHEQQAMPRPPAARAVPAASGATVPPFDAACRESTHDDAPGRRI